MGGTIWRKEEQKYEAPYPLDDLYLVVSVFGELAIGMGD